MSDLVGNPEDMFSQNEVHINPNKPSGLSHPNRLGESTLLFRGIVSIFFISVPVESSLSLLLYSIKTRVIC